MESSNLSRERTKCLMAIHSAVFLFGMAGLFGKLISVSAVIIVLGRVFFASLFLLLILGYLKQGLKLDQVKDYVLLGFLGLVLTVHWCTFFQAIKLSSVAIGLLTFSTFPVFVAFLEPIFFQEKITITSCLIALTTLTGVFLIIPNFELSNTLCQGALWGIVSGFTFALLTILNRKLVKKYSSITVSIYQNLVAMILLFPMLLVIKPQFHPLDFLWLALLGVVFTGIAHTLFIKGLTHVRAQTASIISSLEPIYGIIAAIFLFGNIPSMRTIIGGTIILISALYVTIKK